jgi:hypothetical protein
MDTATRGYLSNFIMSAPLLCTRTRRSIPPPVRARALVTDLPHRWERARSLTWCVFLINVAAPEKEPLIIISSPIMAYFCRAKDCIVHDARAWYTGCHISFNRFFKIKNKRSSLIHWLLQQLQKLRRNICQTFVLKFGSNRIAEKSIHGWVFFWGIIIIYCRLHWNKVAKNRYRFFTKRGRIWPLTVGTTR